MISGGCDLKPYFRSSDRWAEEVGDQRWSWDGLLQGFKDCEDFKPGPSLQGKDLSSYRGSSGPITVSPSDKSK
jgi:hypothetical protein